MCSSRFTDTTTSGAQAEFFLQQGAPPSNFTTSAWLGGSPGEQGTNEWLANGVYYIALKPSCPGTASCISGKVNVELSCYAYNGTNFIPVHLVNNRRTARYHLSAGQFMYFWFTVEPQDVQKDGSFTFYLSVSLWQGMNSKVQVFINHESTGWPKSATIGNDFTYPLVPQAGSYLWSAQPLTQGVYYGAIYGVSYEKSTIDSGSDIGIAIKAGYNQAPSNDGFKSLPTYAALLLILLSLLSYL